MITRSHDATKERMMDAVLTASEDCGFENLTTKKWARTASVAEGSLYNHFNNKEDLLEQTFLRTDRVFVMQLNSIFVKSAGSGSVQSAADKIINTYLVFLCDHSSELYFYQAFSCTKIYKVRTRIKLAENWAHMQEGFKLYHFKNEETAKELQSFFKETVNSYAEYLCNLDHETSDEDIEYIRKLLIMMLSYIMEEREEKKITAIDEIEDEESEEAGEEGKATARKGKASTGKSKAAAGKAKEAGKAKTAGKTKAADGKGKTTVRKAKAEGAVKAIGKTKTTAGKGKATAGKDKASDRKVKPAGRSKSVVDKEKETVG